MKQKFESDRAYLDVSIIMPRGHAKLFELRLKLRRTKLANGILSKCVQMFAVSEFMCYARSILIIIGIQTTVRCNYGSRLLR